MNIIIITGASSGIGAEFARQLDLYFKTIDDFWLIGRDRTKLLDLVYTLEHPCRVFAIDLTEEENLNHLTEEVSRRSACVRMLFNCAGYGIMGAFAKQALKSELGMIRLNCEALTSLTHRLLPFMKKGSRIIQMASSAAFLPQADFAVYAATKSYVLSFSRALARELRPREIYVTAVCPGPVDTPFFEIAEANGSTLNLKKMTMVSPKAVVEEALRDSFHKRTMSVCHLPIKGFRVLAKCLPHNLLLDITGKMKEQNL